MRNSFRKFLNFRYKKTSRFQSRITGTNGDEDAFQCGMLKLYHILNFLCEV